MKQYFLTIFMMLCLVQVGFGGQKVFYNAAKNHEIVDVSGKKTAEQIKKEFGLESVVEATLEDGESYRITNGQIEKYSRKAHNDAIAAEKEQERKAKENSIKQKLGLSQKEFDDLKESLK